MSIIAERGSGTNVLNQLASEDFIYIWLLHNASVAVARLLCVTKSYQDYGFCSDVMVDHLKKFA